MTSKKYLTLQVSAEFIVDYDVTNNKPVYLFYRFPEATSPKWLSFSSESLFESLQQIATVKGLQNDVEKN